jgi:hypothetical protein
VSTTPDLIIVPGDGVDRARTVNRSRSTSRQCKRWMRNLSGPGETTMPRAIPTSHNGRCRTYGAVTTTVVAIHAEPAA